MFEYLIVGSIIGIAIVIGACLADSLKNYINNQYDEWITLKRILLIILVISLLFIPLIDYVDAKKDKDKKPKKKDIIQEPTTKKKSKSDNKDYLDRPSFGLNYRTLHQEIESGIRINSINSTVDNYWRTSGNTTLTGINTLEINTFSIHGIKDIRLWFNVNDEKKTQYSKDKISLYFRGNNISGINQVGEISLNWIGLGLGDKYQHFTLGIQGNNTGIISIEVMNKAGYTQYLFIHPKD